jgi:hypothetical protein
VTGFYYVVPVGGAPSKRTLIILREGSCFFVDRFLIEVKEEKHAEKLWSNN